jgi:acyl-CoA synthetase (NDP forming)
MQPTMTEGRLSAIDDGTVREVLDAVRADGRSSLSAPEAKRVCDAYGIEVPQEGWPPRPTRP